MKHDKIIAIGLETVGTEALGGKIKCHKRKEESHQP